MKPAMLKKLMGLGFIALSIITTNQTFAQETAQVLPASIHRFRVVGVMTGDIQQKYNTNGDVESLSRSLNRSVTVNDLANAGTAESQQLALLVNALNGIQSGLGDQLSNSDLYSDFKTNAQIYLPAFEYGLTNKLSIGARMPVVKRTITNRLNVSTLNNASAIAAQLGNINPAVTAGLYDFSSKQFNQSFFEKALFTDKGYQAPHDFQDTHVGDLEFGGKYNFFKDDVFTSTVLLGARAPTGSTQSLTNIFDPGTGKGAWGVGVQMLQEIEAAKDLTFGGAAKVSYNFSDTRPRAVPKDANDTLPSLLPKDGQVQNTTRTLGMMLDTELSAGYRLLDRSVQVWSAYQYSAKAKDKFSGPGNLYYAGLASNTDSYVHTAELGAGYSTIPAFRRGKFKVPMEVTLLYNTPFRGRNATIAPFTRLDLMLYF